MCKFIKRLLNTIGLQSCVSFLSPATLTGLSTVCLIAEELNTIDEGVHHYLLQANFAFSINLNSCNVVKV